MAMSEHDYEILLDWSRRLMGAVSSEYTPIVGRHITVSKDDLTPENLRPAVEKVRKPVAVVMHTRTYELWRKLVRSHPEMEIETDLDMLRIGVLAKWQAAPQWRLPVFQTGNDRTRMWVVGETRDGFEKLAVQVS